MIQLVLITAEAIMMFAVYGLLRRLNVRRPLGILLVAVALNPISLFLTLQHGNFDIFVGLWILLFTWTLLDFYQNKFAVSWLAACFFLGIAILTKTVPVVLIPLLAVGIRNINLPPPRIFGLLLVFTPVIIGMSVIYTLAPEGVTNNVLKYRSIAGYYGVTGLLVNLELPQVSDLYRTISPYIFLILFLFLSWRCIKADILLPKQFITTALLIMVFIPTFGPGYSPPYIYWFMPLLILFYSLAERGIRRYLLAGYIILVLTYITEYAFFPSHGAFATKIDTTSSMESFCEWFGARKSQVFVRIPMFLFYLGLVAGLIKTMSSSTASPGASRR